MTASPRPRLCLAATATTAGPVGCGHSEQRERAKLHVVDVSGRRPFAGRVADLAGSPEHGLPLPRNAGDPVLG